MRYFDVLFSFFTILILSPLFVIVIMILKFTGEGEVFYLQDRVGKSGKIFRLIKFATMLKNSPNIGSGTITIENDPRILPIGKILRKSKINELPQLVNVLFGHMSLIGPRPLAEKNFNMYPEDIQETIIKVRPGLSGVGSIIFRDEENLMTGSSATIEFYAEVIAPYKGELEKWFISNANIKVYFKCILLTLVVILNSKSNLPWLLLKGLPAPEGLLKSKLYFREG